MSVSLGINTEGTIIVFRPLYELKNHMTHFTIPDIFLLIRVVKACALAIFRWHFYETDSVCVRSDFGFVHNINGKIQTSMFREDIDQLRPFSLKSAAIFIPKINRFDNQVKFETLKAKGSLSLTNVEAYFRDTLKDAFFKNGSTLWDHLGFTLTPYKDCTNL